MNELNIYNFDDAVTTNEKSIQIDFDSIFGMSGLNDLGTLYLKKRSYYSISNLIVDTIIGIFNDCQEDIVLPYLNVICKIKDTDKEYLVEDFQYDILNDIINQEVMDSISDYIGEEYSGTMDAKTEETKKSKDINIELQFTDEHVAILFKSAEAIRLCIPLVTQYYDSRPDKKDLNDLLYDIFLSIIGLFEGKVNIFNKLHRFIYSRVVQTQYSDKTIWNLLSNKSKDVSVVTLEFLQDIIIGILPKSNLDKELVNLFHVVIKRKTQFEFQKDYHMSFKPMNLNQTDSDGLTQFDKWEITLSKKNESKIIINKFTISHELRNIYEKFGFKIVKDEFDYYKDNIIINDFQKQYLFLYYAKYVGSYESLYNCSRDEYIYLLILLYKQMNAKGYKILQKYLMAIPDKLNEKRISNKGNKIFERVINSQIYNQLINNKYKFIDMNIIESNYIIKIIGNLTVSKYLELYDYETFKEKNLKNPIGNEVEDKVEVIADDILNFLIEI